MHCRSKISYQKTHQLSWIILVAERDGEDACGAYSYSNMIRMLQYLQSHSRLDLTFVVGQLARFVHGNQRSQEVALEIISQYLKRAL